MEAPVAPVVISAGLMTANESVGGGFCVGTTLFQWYTPTGRQTPAQYNSHQCGGVSAPVETLSGQMCSGTQLISAFAPRGRQEVSDAASPVCGVVPVNAQGPGRFESAVLINVVEKVDIAAATKAEGLPGIEPRYAVSNYKLTYLTVDGYGNPVRASALVVIPNKPDRAPSPVVSYQHGTLKTDAEAPSNHAVPNEMAVMLASMGYVVLASDYVGYGESKGTLHPYLLAEPSAAAVNDLLTASRYWRAIESIGDNHQLFMAGYSEGAYVTMAALRGLQSGANASQRDLVKSVLGSGPYSVELTLNDILSTIRGEYPVLGALISPGFLRYLSDGNRAAVRNRILDGLLGKQPDVPFQSTFLDNFLADDTAAIRSQSNVFEWRPEQPIELFHGRDDLTVPYGNSTLALQTMQSLGAGKVVTLTDCKAPTADHTGCITPFMIFLTNQLTPLARNL